MEQLRTATVSASMKKAGRGNTVTSLVVQEEVNVTALYTPVSVMQAGPILVVRTQIALDILTVTIVAHAGWVQTVMTPVSMVTKNPWTAVTVCVMLAMLAGVVPVNVQAMVYVKMENVGALTTGVAPSVKSLGVLEKGKTVVDMGNVTVFNINVSASLAGVEMAVKPQIAQENPTATTAGTVMEGWMGPACDDPCVHGKQEPMDSGICKCYTCYTGYNCDSECSGNGQCVNGRCECDNWMVGNSFVGELCEQQGCPGENCNAHGSCNSATQTCTCYPGWSGDDCSIPDCPGSPSCSGHGKCLPTVPRTCLCESDWAGEICDIPCLHGNNINGTECICEDCYSGIGCHDVCSGNGICVNNTCECYFEAGYKGDVCSIPGCPGWPHDCSNHGTCNLAVKECTCDPGWRGVGCQIPDCPGTPDCLLRGDCLVPPGEEDPRCVNCIYPYMGDGCELTCIHGTPERTTNGTWICHCNPCYNGLSCEMLCSNHSSQCINNQCDCGFDGWRGEYCEVKGCPGYDIDCSGHGDCNSQTGACYCQTGWAGIGCHLPDCPGTPDCNNRGICYPSDPPECQNCTQGWMGPACELPCTHGQQIPMNSGNCTCEPCYHGIFCDQMCSGVGECKEGTCNCPFFGGRGEYCENPGCPGVDNLDCSGHGTCIIATGTCICNEGWEGIGCEFPNCPGQPNCNDRGVCYPATIPECRNCSAGWMGPACELPCGPDHGRQNPMDSGICECDPCYHGDDCRKECNNYGQCRNGTCDCTDQAGFNNGYWGEYCDIIDCPGMGSPCTGHGFCNFLTHQCVCEQSWYGPGCHLGNCPGTPDCNDHGQCDITGDIPNCRCDAGWMGASCDRPCVNGTVTPEDTCVCDPCYYGPGCDLECSNHGSCQNDQCSCDEAWRGEDCSIRGCPGELEDCSGHGYCNRLDQVCYCQPNWKGPDCNTPDCPGTPDCRDRGYCDGTNYDPPRCVNCTQGWMGSECQVPCTHGVQQPMDSGFCDCFPCYSGTSCDMECTDHGTCQNGTCQCQSGYEGDMCQDLDCPGEPDCTDRGTCVRRGGQSICLCNPGFGGLTCSDLVCPGEPACSSRGICTIVGDTTACVCEHGYDGEACDRCLPRFAGDFCDECEEGYIGSDTDCSVLCLHGNATEPGGRQCACYTDEVNGFWVGASCDQCMTGYALPTCTQCHPDFASVDGDCSVACIVGHGEYREPLDGEGGRSPVEPFINCVSALPDVNGAYMAWLGYINHNEHNVDIPLGVDNKFFSMGPSTVAENLGQPSKFRVGNHSNVFHIRLADETVNVVWRLAYTLSNSAFRLSISADYPIKCTGEEITEDELMLQNNQTIQGSCQCHHGYWGSSCRHQCPGGGHNPCYGNGVCESTNGTCSCSTRFTDTPDCRQCSDGWIGRDCSVSVTELSSAAVGIHVGNVFSNSHFTTFDGCGFDFHGAGEYLLYHHQTEDITIHVRFVPCSQDSLSSCIDAVAIQVSTETLVIHGGISPADVGGVVWYNGQITSIGEQVILPTGYTIERPSIDRYFIQSRAGFYMQVSVSVLYIDLYLQVTTAYCSAATGLLSSCDDNAHNDFLTSDGILLTTYHTNGTLSQDSIHNNYGPSWFIHSDNSLFVYGYRIHDEHRNITGNSAGYALFFNDTYMSTGPLYTFSESDITIELDVQLNETAGCGTILSYTLEGTFALQHCGGHMELLYGTHSYSHPTLHFNQPAVNLQTGIWYHIALVWQMNTNQLILYVFNPNGNVQSLTGVFSSLNNNIFAPGGTLTLGKWTFATNIYSVADEHFVGWMDELVIWNIRLDASQIRDHIGMYHHNTTAYLASLWHFNEGVGTICHDSVSLGHFHMTSQPWRAPVWVFSALHISSTDVNLYYKVHFSSTTFQHQVQEFCQSLFLDSDMSRSCAGLGVANTERYYLSCIYDIVRFNNFNRALYTVVAYADYCEAVLQLPSWPAQHLCHMFPEMQFPHWTGTQCNVPCVGGYTSSEEPDQCVCYHGYWGPGCSHLCPGGVSLPCGGEGTCDVETGHCTCPANFDDSSNCINCVANWEGSQCQIANPVAAHSTPPFICSVFSYSHYVTFDGTAYNLPTAGEYVFLQSPDFSVYTRQVPCGGNNLYCVNQVWVQTPNFNITLHAPFKQDADPVVWEDGQELVVDLTVTLHTNWTIQRKDLYTFQLQHSSGQYLNMEARDRFLSLHLSVDSNSCLATERQLCGKCDGNRDNDFHINAGHHLQLSTVTTQEIIHMWAPVCTINSLVDTAFIYDYGGFFEEQFPTNGGFSLAFNDSSCYTGTLTETFNPNKDVTIEFSFRPDNVVTNGGTVFSYADHLPFAVTCSGTLQIHYGSHIYDTHVNIINNEWTHVAVTYERETGGCTIYIIHHTGHVEGTSFVIGIGFFLPTGTIALGQWQYGTDPSVGSPPPTHFVGQIDKLVIWDRVFSIYEIIQNAEMTFDVSVLGVSGLWQFSEGWGTVGTNLVDLFSTPYTDSNLISLPSLGLHTCHPTYQSNFDQENGNCTCHTGYWGTDCSNLCPGGTVNTCNSHGTCNPSSGQCECDAAWSETTNCSTCAPGWEGDDCSVFVANKTDSRPMCKVFGQGHFTAFDGTGFVYKEPGEFFMLQNTDLSFSAQVRITPCYNQSACISAFALSYRTNYITVRAGYTSDSKLLIWKDGETWSSDGAPLVTPHFTLSQESSHEYNMLGLVDSLSVKIRVLDRYLSVTMHTSQQSCLNGFGICGSCNGNTTSNITDISTIVTDAWGVSANESLFTCIFNNSAYHEQPIITGAGHCLHFSDASVTSHPTVSTFSTDQDITVQFHIHAEANTGIVFSYSHTTSFTVFLQGTVHLAVGSNIYDTTLSLEIGVWNQITIVWDRQQGHIVVFLLNSLYLQREEIDIGTTVAVFAPGGTIAIGQWQPCRDPSVTSPSTATFVGQIDELHVWHTAFYYSDISEWHDQYIDVGTPNIAGLWHFDEGEGHVIYDIIGGAHLYISEHTWVTSRPTWLFSYVQITVIINYDRDMILPALQTEIRDHCEALVLQSRVSTTCAGMGEASLQYYYSACVKDSTFVGTYLGPLSSVMAMADQCYAALPDVTTWPGQPLCNSFPTLYFPIWQGDNCNVECRFPSTTGNLDTCTCAAGYWGPTCTNICKTGTINVCNGHGVCRQTDGECDCDINWSGDPACSTCSPGWRGLDCSLAVTTVSTSGTATTHLCSIFGSGYYTLFDGSSIPFRESGEFQVFHYSDITIQIRQTPCNNIDVCLVAVAVNVGGTTSIIHAPYTTASDPVVWVNNAPVSVDGDVDIGGGNVAGYTLRRESLNRMVITGPNGFSLALLTQETHFNMDLQIGMSWCSSSTAALCGPCSSVAHSCTAGDTLCLIQHFGLAAFSLQFSLTQTLIQQFLSHWQVNPDSSFFAAVLHQSSTIGITLEPAVPTGAGTALFFNGTVASSLPIPSSIFTSTFTSVQFHFNTFSDNCTLVSFAHDNTFAVTIQSSTLYLLYGSITVSTGIQVTIQEWNRITIVYSQTTGNCDIYLFTSTGVMSFTSVYIGTHVFVSGGTFAVGHWQESNSGSGSPPPGIFVGLIDQFVVWNNWLSPTAVIQSWQANVAQIDHDVILIWDFNGGPDNTCNGNGECDIITGQCMCEENWQGDATCGSCTDGWGGSECSIILPQLPEDHALVCSAHRSGTIIQYSGYLFEYLEIGDFYLLQTEDFEVQVRQVSCLAFYRPSVCIRAVAVSFKDLSLSIQYTTEGAALTYMNGDMFQTYDSYTFPAWGGCGLTIQSYGGRGYQVSIVDMDFSMDVWVSAGYMDVNVQLPNSLCCNALMRGLCGSCDQCSSGSNQGMLPCGLAPAVTTPLPSGTTAAPTSTSGTVSITTSASLQDILDMASSCAVAGEDSGFVTDDFTLIKNTAALYCLYFEGGSSATASYLDIPEGEFTTLEMYIKTCGTAECGGTIFSYTSQETLFVSTASGTLSIHHGNDATNMDLAFEDNQWNLLTLVWSRNFKYLSVYLIDHIGYTRRRSALLSSDIFPPGGTLALGSWQPGTGDDEDQPDTSKQFVGYIDEIRIWNRFFTGVSIEDHWNRSIEATDLDLIAMWKLDEGTGFSTVDAVANKELNLPTAPFPSPSWRESDAPLPYVSPYDMGIPTSTQQAGVRTGHGTQRSKRDTTNAILQQAEVETFCRGLILEGSIERSCNTLGQALLEHYFYQCVDDVKATNSKSAAMSSVLELADYCQAVLDLNTWPAQPLCNEFGYDVNFPLWIGQRCDIRCESGTRNPQDLNDCNCYPGYWGSDCSKPCPGNTTTGPCNGFGKCDAGTGICNCPSNWQGQSCSECSPGWTGTDCSLAVASPLQGQSAVAKVFGAGHVTNFAATSFLYQGVGDRYLLMSTNKALSIQATFVACYLSYSCIQYVAIQFGSQADGFVTLVVSVSREDNGRLVSNINGLERVLDNDVEFGLSGFTLRRYSYFELGLEGPRNVSVTVRSNGKFLSIDVMIPSNLCNSFIGLLSGHCDQQSSEVMDNFAKPWPLITSAEMCLQNYTIQQPLPLLNIAYDLAIEYALRNSTWNQTDELNQDYLQQYGDHWTVPDCDKVSSATQVITGGYSLKFNNAALFPENPFVFLKNSDLTIEVMIKCDNVSICGTVLSYSSRETFSLIINETIQLHQGMQTYNTGYVPPTNKWIRLTIVYEYELGKINIYMFNMRGMVKRQEFDIPTGIFNNDGTFAFGQWQAPLDGVSRIPHKPFFGELDDLRIWTTALSPPVTMQSWDYSIPPFSLGLAAYWYFDEGQGTKAAEVTSDSSLSMLSQPWNSPHWSQSNMPILKRFVDLSIGLVEFDHPDTTLKQQADTMCQSLLQSLASHCTPLGNGPRQFYHLACLREVSTTGDINEALETISHYADLKQISAHVILVTLVKTAPLPVLEGQTMPAMDMVYVKKLDLVSVKRTGEGCQTSNRVGEIFNLQVYQTPCFSGSTCASALGLQINEETLAIIGSITSNGRLLGGCTSQEIHPSMTIDEVTQEFINGELSETWRVTPEESLILHNNYTLPILSGGEYCLSFNNADGGILSLGQWQPSPEASDKFPNTSFNGLIEEFRIWKQHFHPSTIKETTRLNPVAHAFSGALSALYKFNEGSGDITHDPIHRNHINLPNPPWPRPQWTFSDAELPVLRMSDTLPLKSMFVDKSLETEAKTICSVLLLSNTILQHCQSLGDSSSQLFYLACLQDVSVTSDITAAFGPVVAFAEYCDQILNTGGTVVQSLCILAQNYTTPNWFESTCTDCAFGTNMNGDCQCQDGFWGTNCTKECPGGGLTPCNNHGVCNNDGTCACELNWSGHNDCGTCSDGWIGSDCSVVISTTSSTSQLILYGQLLSFGTFTFFDSVTIFGHQEGAYLLLSHTHFHFSLTIREVMCVEVSGSMSCFDSIYVTYGGTEVIILASLLTTDGSIGHIIVNHQTQPVDHVMAIADNFQISREDGTTYLLSFSDIDVHVSLVVLSSHLHVSLTVPAAFCRDSSGMFGNCGDSTLDKILAVSCLNEPATCTPHISQSAVDAFLATYEVPFYVNVTDAEHLVPVTTAGYCLYFEDSIITSRPLHQFPTTTFTFEMLIKPVSYGGTILSYTTSQVFAILNIATGIEIHSGETVHTTNLVLELGVWNQIAFVWRPELNLLEFYLFNAEGQVSINAFYLNTGVFNGGGTLAFGQWYASGLDTVPDAAISVFVGMIDEIRIWEGPVNPSIVAANWGVNVRPGSPDLAMLWSLNEGKGEIAGESESEQHLYFPTHNHPTWVVSDAPVSGEQDSPSLALDPSIADASNSSSNGTSPEDAAETCRELIFSKPLKRECSVLTNSTFDTFYQLCIMEVALTGDNEVAKTVAEALIAYCDQLLEGTSIPDNILCGDTCPEDCVFGELQTHPSMCQCFHGYWGTDCSHPCPGEISNTCGNHGTCNVNSGECVCEEGWDDSSACMQCEVGLLGSDCSVAQLNTTITPVSQQSSSITIGVFTIFGYFHVTTFDGAAFELMTAGAYSAYIFNGLSVQLYTTPFPDMWHVQVITEISINYGGLTISASLSSITSSQIVVQKNDGGGWQSVVVGTTFTHQSVTVEWISTDIVEVTYQSTTVYIVMIADILSLGILAPKDELASGLCGPFDGNMINDLSDLLMDPADVAEFLDSGLSQPYLEGTLGPAHKVDTPDNHLHLVQTTPSLTTGYLLHIDSNHVYIENIGVIVLHQLTVGVWVKLDVTTATQTIYVISTQRGEIALLVVSGHLEILWQGQTFTTTLQMTASIWTYLCVTWREFDGRLELLQFHGDDEYSFTHTVGTVGQLTLSGSVTIGQYVVAEEITEVRTTCPVEEMPGRVLSLTMDQGHGQEFSVDINTPSTNSSRTRTRSRVLLVPADSPPEWRPSDVPVDCDPADNPPNSKTPSKMRQ
ncbi:hypothetical protein Bbelb_427260 [Branchiostoma belcheri]|nr:hypothetical protein Bbelb_427260 [Branchiostoma belcheri]